MASFTPQQIEEFLQEFFDVVGTRQYTGARYVPIFGRAGEDTVEWDDRAPYEPLTVVMHQGVSYVSRRYVPTGIPITDVEYWAQTYRFNAQVEAYRQEVEAFQGQIDQIRADLEEDYVPFPDERTYPKYGTAGQVLTTLGDGGTMWEDPVIVTPEVAGPIIEEWLDDHPEATTTVQDGSITDAKLAQDGGILETVRAMNNDFDYSYGGTEMLSSEWLINKVVNTQGAYVSSDGYMATTQFFKFDHPILFINLNQPSEGRLNTFNEDYTPLARYTRNAQSFTIEANTLFKFSLQVSSVPLENAQALARNVRIIHLVDNEAAPYPESACVNLFKPEDATPNKTFSGITDSETTYEGALITDYIPVRKGWPIKVYLEHVDMLSQANATVKLAYYDQAKNWLCTRNLSDSSTPFSATGWYDGHVDGYVRVATTGHRNLATLMSTMVVLSQACTDATAHGPVPGLLEAREMDMRGYDPANTLVGKAYSGTTSTIVDADTYTITGFIPVRWNDVVTVTKDGVPIDALTFQSFGLKFALFDSELNWMRTVPTNQSTEDASVTYYQNNSFRADLDGYVRLQYRHARTFELNVSAFRQIAGSAIGPGPMVDVIVFAGQSNMAGRGTANQAPTVPYGHAWEYRAITDPTHLHPLAEPFGENENNPNGINDGTLKTGSMVSAFANAYWQAGGNVPLVGVSASKGGSGIDDWQPNAATNYLSDAISRLQACLAYLASAGHVVRHTYLCWCQGEHDYAHTDTYQTLFQTMMAEWVAAGVERCLMVRIGNERDDATAFSDMIETQTEMAQTDPSIVMASTTLAGMGSRGLMKDNLHYTQTAYNECGTYAGTNAGTYALTGKEQTMYDPEYTNLYYSHKN